MNTIPEAEARALLARPQECVDCPDWSGWKLLAGSVQTSMGLVDANGMGTRMQVVLRFHRSAKTKITHHLLTVFKMEPYGLERVYQLDVKQFPRPVKDAHQKPHEHWGALRTLGAASWATWSYEQVLAHFSQQTNIIFLPQPKHPEAFELKRQ